MKLSVFVFLGLFGTSFISVGEEKQEDPVTSDAYSVPDIKPDLKGDVKAAGRSFVRFLEMRTWIRTAKQRSANQALAFEKEMETWRQNPGGARKNRIQSYLQTFDMHIDKLRNFVITEEKVQSRSSFRKIYSCAVERKRLAPDGDSNWKIEDRNRNLKYKLTFIRISGEWRILDLDW